MTKHLRTVKACLIIGFVLLSTGVAMIPSTSAKLLTYDAALEIKYNPADLTDLVFQPDGPPQSLSLTIRFRVDIPPSFLQNMVLRLIFLQTMIITSAQVRLSVENSPSWAAVSITPQTYINISNEFQETQAVVSIAPHSDAPAEGFVLRIKAVTDPLLNGHVAAKEAYTDINFQPGYIPLINVEVDNPSRTINPQETTTFHIKITNLGNKETLVTGRVVSAPKGWAPLLSQTQITIPSAEESGGNNYGTISFSVTPPYGVGWHNDLGSITLEFTPQFSPPGGTTPGQIGTAVPVPLLVRSQGFSTPGFEAAGLLFALIVAITLIMMKRKNIQN